MGICYYFDLVPYVDMLLADDKFRIYRQFYALNLISPQKIFNFCTESTLKARADE